MHSLISIQVIRLAFVFYIVDCSVGWWYSFCNRWYTFVPLRRLKRHHPFTDYSQTFLILYNKGWQKVGKWRLDWSLLLDYADDGLSVQGLPQLLLLKGRWCYQMEFGVYFSDPRNLNGVTVPGFMSGLVFSAFFGFNRDERFQLYNMRY